MAFSHYSNFRSSVRNYEPIFNNLFEVIITPPSRISQSPNIALLSEQIKKVVGLPELTPSPVVKQYAKFSSRSYADARPEKTDAQISIDFELNLNEENDNFVYNIYRGWADLIYNPMTGKQGMKKDYVGELYIAQHNRDLDIFREYRFKPVFLFSKGGDALTAPVLENLAQGDNGIMRFTAHHQCDAYVDTRIGEIK